MAKIDRGSVHQRYMAKNFSFVRRQDAVFEQDGRFQTSLCAMAQGIFARFEVLVPPKAV